MNLPTMLRTADGYFLAGKAILDTQKNAVDFLKYYISPCAVNLAFACEIYLKYLYSIENQKAKAIKTHGLLDLFSELEATTQGKIKADYEKWTSLFSFDDCIKVHNRAFEDFRYMYEDEKNGISIEPQSLYNLAVAIKNTCTMKQEEIENAD
ncbi:MAG: hypothetical protein GX345_03475 [Clostridiales bacterium]|nr:hypothetical protein [Clostridiales bacterium]